MTAVLTVGPISMEWDRLGTPLEIAQSLWSRDALKLPPMTFGELFDRAYSQTNDLETLWQLGGAINDFLRHRPGVLAIPPQLPSLLLRSDDVEARVVGLKLLNHIDVSDADRIDECVRAIARGDGYESVGGLHELGRFLKSCQGSGKRIPTASAERILRCLQACPERDEENCRAWVAHLVELMEGGGTSGTPSDSRRS